MSEGPRYAIYFVPAPDTDLYRFGSTVLGYDCYAGAGLAHAPDFGLDTNALEELTREPRRYGFHATLKAPFYLSPACTEAQLASALASFAALGRVVPVIAPAVRILGGFVAIVPRDPCPDVEALAADCVTLFDAFRAPMSARERARRVASGLSPAQVNHLDRWGYPYLFDEFRFHMTLTGRVRAGHRSAVLVALQDAFMCQCGDHPIRIDRLALVRQDHADARFKVVRHFSVDVSR